MSNNQIRVVWALYDWQEEVDFSVELGVLDELLRTAHISPNKVQFLGEFGEGPRRVLGKSTDRSKIFSVFPIYRAMSLHDTRGTDFSNTNGSLVLEYDSIPKRYSCVLPAKMYNSDVAIDNMSVFLKFHSAQFGFVYRAPNGQADNYPGFTITDAASTQGRRMDSLERLVRRERGYLQGKMHDVYELNVLNDSHLNHTCAGTTLASWVEQSGCGRLFRANNVSTMWMVPDELRQIARDTLRACEMLTIAPGV